MLNKIYKDINMILNIDGTDIDIVIDGIVDQTYDNRYRTNSEKVIYLPIEKYQELFKNSYPILMYILEFNKNADIMLIKDNIESIYSQLKFYSTGSLHSNIQLNKELINKISYVLLTIEIGVIYSRICYAFQKKYQLALLNS